MNQLEYYSLITIIATLGGAFLPFYIDLKEDTLKRYLALSAGVIIGFTLFHLIPEFIQFDSIRTMDILLIILGFYLPIFINKGGFLEIKDATKHKTINSFSFFSFSIHAFLDGVIMLSTKIHMQSDTAFYLILLHRIPVSFSLFTILKSHMRNKLHGIILLISFVLMTPLGLYTTEFAMIEFIVSYSKELLAFSSGILLYIAFYHLLFEHKLLVVKYAQYIFAGFFFSLLTKGFH